MQIWNCFFLCWTFFYMEFDGVILLGYHSKWSYETSLAPTKLDDCQPDKSRTSVSSQIARFLHFIRPRYSLKMRDRSRALRRQFILRFSLFRVHNYCRYQYSTSNLFNSNVLVYSFCLHYTRIRSMFVQCNCLK